MTQTLVGTQTVGAAKPTTTQAQQPTTTASTEPLATTTTAPPLTLLDIIIGSNAGPEQFVGSIECTGGMVVGTGYFLTDADPDAACELLFAGGDPVSRLINGPATDVACTEIYGGSEVATVGGLIDGVPFATEFHRNNGCGIFDWELVQPILVPPFDLG